MTEKTTTGRLIAAVGGIVLIVSLFLDWYSISTDLGTFGGQVSSGRSAFDALGIEPIILFLCGVLAIVPAALDIFDLEVELPFENSVATLAAGGIAVVIIVLRILVKPGPDIDVPGFDYGLSFGIFLGLIGAGAVAFGGFTQKGESDAAPAAYAAPPVGAPPTPPQGMPPQQPVAPPTPAAPPQAAPPVAPPPPPAAPPQAPPPPPQPPQAPPPAG